MEKTKSVSPLALGFLIGFEQHISSPLLLLNLRYNEHGYWLGPSFEERGGPGGFMGLHGAAFFGIVEMVAALLIVKEWDINATDAVGRTALAWAAVGGHEDVANILLQREYTNPNTADTSYGRTPLLWAAERGNEGVVELLLGRKDINPDMADTEYGRTPLWWAAERGHEGVVKLLSERDDVNPYVPDLSGKTALELAACCEHTRVVELLSVPNPPLSVPADLNVVLQHPSPEPADPLQSLSLPASSTCSSSPKPSPSDIRPLLENSHSSHHGYFLFHSLLFSPCHQSFPINRLIAIRLPMIAVLYMRSGSGQNSHGSKLDIPAQVHART